MTSLNIGLLPKLTKDYILTYLTQEQIFERYVGFPVDLNHNFCAPAHLWSDTKPSCSYYWSGNKLKLRDFGGEFWGDCFDLVAYIYGLNSNRKEHFGKILEVIARDFKIHKYANGNVTLNLSPLKREEKEIKKKPIDIAIIEPRNITKEDIDYWNKYHIITPEDLKEALIYPTNKLIVNGKYYYKHTILKDVCYTYYFGKLPTNNIDVIKSYFPNRKEGRFYMNVPVLEGYSRLTTADIGIITKSYKDVVCINKMSKLFNFSCEAFAVPAETFLINLETYQTLTKRYKIIVSLMDFDFTGRNLAWRMSVKYGIKPLYFTNGKYNTKKYGSKDFSDYLEINGVEKTKVLMEQSQDYLYKRYDL